MATNEKGDRHQLVPFALRMSRQVREAAETAAKTEDRSINWVLNDRLAKAFGVKEAA